MKKNVLLILLLLSASWMLKAQSYSGGSGTLGDPYQIATKADLKYLSEHSGEWSKHFKQTANITFTDADFQSGGEFYNSGAGFIPIGSNISTNFTGSYDGDGYTIDNLYINRSSTEYIGLFGYASGATISNLGVTNVDIAGKDYVGGLVGANYFSSTVSNSYSTGSVEGSGNSVGGLVGWNYFASTVSNSYSTGSVSGGQQVGGLVGWNNYFSTVSNSYSTGDVTRSSGSDTYFGGFCGLNELSTIEYCYSTGSVFNSDGSTALGTANGFVGCDIGGTYTNNFWDSEASNQSTATGATGKTTTEMKAQSTFTSAGWNFTTIWAISASVNDGYPYLQSNVPPTSDYYYRSSSDGNWSTVSNWEVSTDDITWSAASHSPTASNSIGITIRNDVIVDSDISIDQTTINSGATLTVSSGITLTINDGDGTDLAVNGTLDMDGGTLTLNGTRSYGSSSTLTYSNSAAAQTTTTNELPASGCVNLIINNTNGVTLNDATSISGDLTVNSGTFTIGDNNFTTSGATDINGALSIGTATYDANDSFDATGGNITFTGAGTLKLGGTVTSLGTFTSGTGTVVYDGADQTVLSGSGLSYNAVKLEGSGTKTISDALIATTFDPTNAAYNVELFGDGTTITNAVDFQNTGTVTLGDASSDVFTFTGGISIKETGGPTAVSIQGTVKTSTTAGAHIAMRKTTITGNATFNSFSNGIDIYDNLVINDGVTLTVEGNRTPPLMAIYFHNTINSASGGTGNLTLNSDYFVYLAENVGSTDALGTLTLTKGLVEWTSPDISLETLQINQGTFGTTNPYGNLDVKDVIISSGTTFKGPNSSGSVNVSGNWTNNGTFTHNNGAVTFDGTSASTIEGATAFYDLTINNSIGVGIYDNYDNTTVENTLTLTHGVVILGEYDLTLGQNATVSGTPSASTMIVTNGSGVLKKEYSSTGSFTFPVGDISGVWEYTPATLNFQSGTFNSGWVSVKVTQGKQSNIPGTTNYINRYWTVTESGITDFSCNTEFQYMSSDVVGDEAEMFGAQYDGSAWTKFTAVNSTDDQINCNGVTGFSDFTARAFALNWTGTVSTDWNTAANWDLNAVPVASTDVTINNVVNAPVISTSTDASCYDLTVATGASLTINSGGSLITNGTITNNGTINIKRNITSGVWHLISNPITSATANVFVGNYLQNWDETSGTWSDIVETSTSLTPVKGYSLWTIDGTPTDYTFTGTPNTGNQSLAITHTEVAGSGFDGANLLGNPYPSSIDWSGLDDTYGAVNYWNGTGYVSWNNGSGSGSQYIPPMQGFFIVTGTAGTFSVGNANRTHTGATNYYKSLTDLSAGLVLFADNGSYRDDLWLLQRENRHAGFDLESDAYKFMSSTPGISQLWSVCPDGNLSIDARPYQETIQLGFANDEPGLYTIGISEIADITSALLEDTKANLFHDLTKDAYEFAWDINDDENRFKLHLNVVGLEETPGNESNLLIYAANGNIFIKGAEKGEVRVSDLTGRIVLQQQINGADIISIPANLKTGIYLVMVQQGKDVKTEKIFIR